VPGALVADESLTPIRALLRPLLSHTSTRRLTSATSAIACVVALAAGLLGPTQTLAQTRRAAGCSSSPVQAKARRTARTCEHASHRGRSHHRKHHSRHVLAKTPKQGVPTSLPAAYCEDGSPPARASNGAFSCADGSEPECEDGAEPTRSSNGRSLVCATLAGEGEEEAETGESECEEVQSSFCTEAPGSDEHSCEATSGESSSFICE
jgi:hypothetical protein